ncbi:hypothetical protein AGR9A_Cc80301 [Agrobacterium salinitolerans str. Hayward 0363]|nr:hypothetical protein AGR9A_Cc80301 [Agrobacterium salinitolerans str. Hayward 0363]
MIVPLPDLQGATIERQVKENGASGAVFDSGVSAGRRTRGKSSVATSVLSVLKIVAYFFSPPWRRNRQHPLASQMLARFETFSRFVAWLSSRPVAQNHLAAPAMHASASANNAASFGTRAEQSLERQPPDGALPRAAHGHRNARQDHFSHSRRGRRTGRFGSRLADC